MRPNPTEARRRRRELFCIHYNSCLSTALQQGWPGFTCKDCEACQHVTWTYAEALTDAHQCAKLLATAFRPSVECLD
jgi:hypothetical protein